MSKLRTTSLCIVLFLAGYLANALLAPKQVQAEIPGDRVYKVVQVSDPGSPAFTNDLNSAAKGGWRLVPMITGGGVLIFEK